MRAHPALLLICAAALAGTPGCEFLVGNDGGGHGSTLPIDSKILVTMSERLAPDDRGLVLNCRTEKEYGCHNYRIGHSLGRSGQTIRIDFRHIDVPELCLLALGPARAEIDLGALAPGGYVLELRAGGRTVTAGLAVSESAYVVTVAGDPAVGFTATRLDRVPDGTVWGLIGYLAPAGQPYDSLAKAFLDSLEVRGAKTGDFAPGDYGYFVIDGSGEIRTPPGHGYYFARPYIRRFDGDPAALREVVAYYGKAHARWLNISLDTWRGDAYYSWVLGSNP